MYKCLLNSKIFEYIDEFNFKNMALELEDQGIRFYMKQVLLGLETCHSNGIIHRDVKTSNMVVNRATKTLKLIDFGLSEFYVPGKDRPLKVASRPYKGPELLVGYRAYDYSLDLWGFGCILGAMMFDEDYLFCGKNNEDQLGKITDELGYNNLKAYLKKYKMKLTKEQKSYITK